MDVEWNKGLYLNAIAKCIEADINADERPDDEVRTELLAIASWCKLRSDEMKESYRG